MQFAKRGEAHLAFDFSSGISRHTDTSQVVAMQVGYRASCATLYAHRHALAAEQVVLDSCQLCAGITNVVGGRATEFESVKR